MLACWFGSVGVGCLWHVGSKSLFVAHQGLPNLSALFLFLGVWQSVPKCLSPNGPPLIIFSGVVTFCFIRIVRWWHQQLFQVRVWPAFEARQKILFIFDSLDWRQLSGIYVSLSPSIGVLCTSFGKLPDFLPNSLGLGH